MEWRYDYDTYRLVLYRKYCGIGYSYNNLFRIIFWMVLRRKAGIKSGQANIRVLQTLLFFTKSPLFPGKSPLLFLKAGTGHGTILALFKAFLALFSPFTDEIPLNLWKNKTYARKPTFILYLI